MSWALRAGGWGTAPRENIVLLLPLAMLAGVLALRSSSPQPQAPSPLRVCADPNNLPFSNSAKQGFENRIADLVGRELKRPVAYTWWAQRRGFVRNTLNARDCDLVVGTVAGMEMLATTRPYYKSTYVFVSRTAKHLDVKSFDDPKLRRLKIGVQLIGDNGVNTPPVHALANRGITGNLVGYPVYGDYRRPNPPARIIDAVANGDVDIAIVWGPLAGYFAKQSREPLDVVPVSPRMDLPYLPFVFDVAMGVRRGDTTFKAQIERIIETRKPAIDSILGDYGVPRVDKVGMIGRSGA
jgi:mxaJ protein